MRIRLIVLSVALASPAAAQDDTMPDFDMGDEAVPAPAPTQGFSGLEPPGSRDHIWVLWQLRRQMLAEGKNEMAEKKLGELLEARLDLGLRNASPLAHGLLAEAWSAAKAGNPKRAFALARSAEALAPDIPEPNLTLARLAVSGDIQPGVALGEALKGVRKTLLHPLRLRRLAGEATLRTLAAVLLTIAVFTLMLWARYGRLLQHDLHDLLPRGSSSRQAMILLLMLALAPPLLGLPIGAVVVLWLVALFGYQRSGERAVSILAVAALATLPWTLRSADRFFVARGGPVEDLFLASEDMVDDFVLEELAKAASGKSPDADVVFVVGLAEKRTGRLYRAEERLKQAFELSGRRYAEAQVVLGNVYLASNRLDEAKTAYESALALAPQSAAAHFNLSKLLHAKGGDDAAVSRSALAALAIDEDRIERFQQHQITALNRYVIDDGLPRKRMFARLLGPASGADTLGPTVWPHVGGTVRVGDAPMLGGIVGLLMLLVWALRSRFSFAAACTRCGDFVCTRCHSGISRTGNCRNCYDVFHRAERVEPRERQRREVAVRAFKRRRKTLSLLLTLVLTGSGHFLVGRALRGLVFSLAFFIFLTSVVAWEGILRPTTPAFPGLPVGQLSVVGVGFGVVYLLALLDIRVEETR